MWGLEQHKDVTVDVSMGTRVYHTSKRVQGQGIHKFRGKSGSLTDDDHHLSVAFQGRYHLMVTVGGIDFVWGQTCTTRSSSEDLIQEFLTMTNFKVSSVHFKATPNRR